MQLRPHAIFLTLITILFHAAIANAFELASGYPQRTNTKRSAPLPGLFDLSATNTGINRADCLETAQRWRFAVADVPADTTAIEIWASANTDSCMPSAARSGNEDAKAPHCFRVARFTTVASGVELETDNLSIVQAIDKKKNAEAPLDAKQVCSKSDHMPPAVVHLHVLALQGTDAVAETDYVTLYDLAGPPAPTGMTTGAGEGMVTVKLKAPATTPSDFAKYRVYCFQGARTAPDAGADADGATDDSKCPAGHPFVPGTIPTSALDAYKCGEHTTIAGDITLEVSQNDVPYAVALAAIDRQENVGILSEVACDTPRATNSFWDNYNAAGGQAGGGCSTGGASPSVLGAVIVVLVAIVVRRRGALAILVLGAVLITTTPGRADVQSEAPSIVMIETRFGPYRPRVDRVGGKTPYRDTFGNASRLMAGAGFEVIPLHIPDFGSIGVGALFGYTAASAKAEFADKSGTSEESTSFNLWVFSALTTLRVDVLARKTRVPVVPYAKVGLMNGVWSSSDGRGVSQARDGREARGRTNGFLYAVGAMLLLDVFDPDAAKTFAAERGVKHSYVFGELTVADLRGFAQVHPMRVGDVTWTAGIAFEM
jgi:uncharacterized protein (TIGR03382 family)